MALGIKLKNSVVKFGATDYALAVQKAQLEPDVSVDTYKTLAPAGVYSDVDTASWTLQLAGLQDYETAASLSRYFFDNAGTQVTATIEPVAGGTSWEVDVIIVPVTIGGEQGSFATFEAELAVVGQPTPTYPV